MKGRNTQWQRRFLKKWAALIYGLEIIFSPIWNYPKQKHNLSAYGDSGANAIWKSIEKWPIQRGKLNSYLADIDEQAEERFQVLIEQMKQAHGITEQLKAENTLEWLDGSITYRYVQWKL